MSTLLELKTQYRLKLSQLFSNNVVNIILSYMIIIAEEECSWCCAENCALLGIDKVNWKPFNKLCKLLKCDGTGRNGLLTPKYFNKKYIGKYVNLDECAKDICETHLKMDNLPWFIVSNINWIDVWRDISVDFYVSDNYVFYGF